MDFKWLTGRRSPELFGMQVTWRPPSRLGGSECVEDHQTRTADVQMCAQRLLADEFVKVNSLTERGLIEADSITMTFAQAIGKHRVVWSPHAIVQFPVNHTQGQIFDHRHDGSDSDAASDQDLFACEF